MTKGDSLVTMENSVNPRVGDESVKEHTDTNNNNNNNFITTRNSSNSSSSTTNSNNSTFSNVIVTPATTATATTTTTNNNSSNDNSNDSDYSHMDNLTVASFSTASAGCGGKYQLRPRSLQARRRSDSEWSLPDTLRHKPRPPPLSRYRRKTANARERYRMRQINTAFESLRGVLPSWVCSRRAATDMTKITTLRLASAYIRSLQDILDGNAPEDTCSWVLSSILGEDSGTRESKTEFKFQEFQPNPKESGPDKIQHAASDAQQDTDFVSLLCSSSDSGVFHDSLETFSYLSPITETEAVALLLGGDASRGWSDVHHTPVVS